MIYLDAFFHSVTAAAKRLVYNVAYSFIPIVHARLQKKIDPSSPIKVAFVVFDKAIWKTDSLFTAMQADNRFEPVIFALEPNYESDFPSTLEYFRDKGYFTVSILMEEGLDRVVETFDLIRPDVVFISNHFQKSIPGIYKLIFRNFLTCYVPYSINVSHYGNNQDQYNTPVHNLLWRNYAPHIEALETFKRVQARKGANVVVTGYPALEPLVKRDEIKNVRKDGARKRVIWAPHHTVDMPALPYSTFLKYADFFVELSKKHSREISWIFKPHPLLKEKLEKHADWGRVRTAKFYQFWEDQEHTQLELGESDGLFNSSDAMIHDSGSFVAEYLYVNKPVMFLWSSQGIERFFNRFGLQALHASERGNDFSDIESFLSNLLADRDVGSAKRAQFLRSFPVTFGGRLPSESIMSDLVDHLCEK